MQRSKINDYFTFPQKIDMRPYKVEHLMDASEEAAEDVFELVGILVHAGTAESGHYYSFIRERPSRSDKATWVEFNDDSVTPWDPNSVESSCYGGLEYRPVEGTNLQYDKSYSAYMLFYERSSVLAAQKQALKQSDVAGPIRLPMPRQLSNHIAGENEIFMRKYCLYDPSHIPFVMKLLSNVRITNKGRGSHNHDLESKAFIVALKHLDQVVSRAKDVPDFPAFMMTLKQMCQGCTECSRDFIEWLWHCKDGLRNMVLKHPDGAVRNEIASSILAALKKVKMDDPCAYGIDEDDDSIDGQDPEDPALIQKGISMLLGIWEVFHSSLRAWPEYFGLLASIANLGEQEVALLLDARYLEKTLQIITADANTPNSPQFTKMLQLITKRNSSRPVSYDAVITLLWKLLSVVDGNIEPIRDNEQRFSHSLSEQYQPLRYCERNLIMEHWTLNNVHILTEKLLLINQNPQATKDILITLLHFPDPLDEYIFNAIYQGFKKSSSLPIGPYLSAALTYCEHSEVLGAIQRMVKVVADAAVFLDVNTEGREHLQFFKDVINLQGNHHDVAKEEILRICIESVPAWAPTLLICYDGNVRNETETLIQSLILRHGPELDLESSEDEIDNVKHTNVTAQKLGIACLDILYEVFVRQRQQAVRGNLINVHRVIESCAPFYYDPEDAITILFQERRDGKSKCSQGPFLFDQN